MFGQGSYGSDLRHRPPAPPPPPPYQQVSSLPAAPLYQQGPTLTPRPFFQQGLGHPSSFQNPPSLAQPPFQQQSLPIPPPPPRLPPPPPPPPAHGVQQGQAQPISLPYQPQYVHERPVLQQTVQQPPVGNMGRPYLPPPPPPPVHGNSAIVPVNQPQSHGGPANPLLPESKNMHQVPSYQHPSHSVRPASFQPSPGQGLPVPGIQHFPMPLVPGVTPPSFSAFLQGTAGDIQPPPSPPPPPPPLPNSPPPPPASPPPDARLQSVDNCVGNISKEGRVDAALLTSSEAFHGEAGHSSKVLVMSSGEETPTMLKLSEDAIQTGSTLLQNERSLQNIIDEPAKVNDSDMDMEGDLVLFFAWIKKYLNLRGRGGPRRPHGIIMREYVPPPIPDEEEQENDWMDLLVDGQEQDEGQDEETNLFDDDD